MRRKVFKLALLLLFAALIAALGTPAAAVEAPAARQPAVEQEVQRGINFGSGWPGTESVRRMVVARFVTVMPPLRLTWG